MYMHDSITRACSAVPKSVPYSLTNDRFESSSHIRHIWSVHLVGYFDRQHTMFDMSGFWESIQETPMGLGSLLLLATAVLWTFYKVLMNQT